MWIAALITGILTVYFALRARYCLKRSKGNIDESLLDGLGVFIFVPLASFSGALTVVFTIIALIQRFV